MIVDEIEQLEALDFPFSRLAFGTKQALNLKQLWGRSAYRSWVQAIDAQIASSQRTDKRAGVGMRYAHRRFDAGWLSHANAQFDLVGVVNRFDRAPFDPAHCGETRLIYRLSYATTVDGMPLRSRLPMTVNLVLWQARPASGSCSEVWRRWGQARDQRSPAHTAKMLAQIVNPDAPNIKTLEVNLQSIRWPSTVHPSLAGHAEYLLMQFSPAKGGGYKAKKLENQPKRRRWSPKQQLAFRRWLAKPKQLAAIREGTLLVPDSYLATAALSAAPHGLARGVNRPFVALMPAKLYQDFPFQELSDIQNLSELTRRLDTMSCTGCHQSRSLAGFHFLGEDRKGKQVDALFVSKSPHLIDELAIRRKSFDTALVSGDAKRPRQNPQRSQAHDPGGWGDHCGLDGHFASWGCKAGLSCRRTSDPQIGVCQLPGDAGPGESCEVGRIVAKARASDERAKGLERRSCRRGVCERNSVGFPSGMCSASCEGMGAQEHCGAIAVLTDFNQCLAQKIPFDRCVQENSRPAALRRCSEEHACRDDMICARAGSKGVCIPPYFLFQLRVDGHPHAS